MPVRTMSSEQARTQWRTLLDLASQSGVDIVIERHGVATAAIISYETYQAIQPALAEMRVGLSGQQRGQKMAAVLEQLAHLPERLSIRDPVAWQIRERKDRALPDRDMNDY